MFESRRRVLWFSCLTFVCFVGVFWYMEEKRVGGERVIVGNGEFVEQVYEDRRETGTSDRTSGGEVVDVSTTRVPEEADDVPQTQRVGTVPVLDTKSSLVGYKRATATVFWVGEGESGDNGFIHNRASAWDVDWEGSFGGYDDPDDRCGFRPCAFEPKLNPFYIALPYLERTETGAVKTSARELPGYTPDTFAAGTLIRGRWVEVRYGDRVCFGQWEDVGPFEMDDVSYVFGDAPSPKNSEGVGAGIDLSPAMRDCLGMGGLGEVWWRLVAFSGVPDGPWRSW